MTTKSKAVATKTSNTAVALADVPEFLRDKMGQARGSEEVGASDLTIPRIEIVQALSECRKKASPSYIEGAQEGMLYNNVTRELYGDNVIVVPVSFKKEFLLWREQKLGGGFGGAYQSELEAVAARNEREKPEEWEVIETPQHFVLIIREDGRTEEAVISMAKTKGKCSRKWNSLIRINGGDRFTRQYEVFGVTDKNGAGKEFYNLDVRNVGFVNEAQYALGEQLWEMVSSGAVRMDTTQEAAAGGAGHTYDNDADSEI